MNRTEVIIEASELLANIDNPNLRIFDATVLFSRKEDEPTAEEIYTNGHIPGAAVYSHQAFSDSSNKYMFMVLPEAELAAQIGRVGISNESEVVVYSTNMLATASRAWWVLRYAGVDNVRILNGGLEAWQAAGGELETGTNQYEPATFTPNLQPEMFATKDEVLAVMADGAVCTVNALPTESYEKNHIKDSAVLPFSQLTIGMQTLAADEQLSAQLTEETKYDKVITYCGGGFAATVNAVAHLIAGNPNVAVYDGSMSEWVGEGLPTEQGSPA